MRIEDILRCELGIRLEIFYRYTFKASDGSGYERKSELHTMGYLSGLSDKEVELSSFKPREIFSLTLPKGAYIRTSIRLEDIISAARVGPTDDEHYTRP